MKRIVTALVTNQPGVLNRITGLFSRRGFNIESIAVGHSELEGLSRMTFVVNMAEDTKIEQIVKQLNKQIDVLKVIDVTDKEIVSRELALIRVAATGTTRQEISGFIDPFRASIVDVSRDSLMIEVTGESTKIDALIELLQPYGIKDISRTGTIAIPRGLQKEKYQSKTILYV